MSPLNFFIIRFEKKKGGLCNSWQKHQFINISLDFRICEASWKTVNVDEVITHPNLTALHEIIGYLYLN